MGVHLTNYRGCWRIDILKCDLVLFVSKDVNEEIAPARHSNLKLAMFVCVKYSVPVNLLAITIFSFLLKGIACFPFIYNALTFFCASGHITVFPSQGFILGETPWPIQGETHWIAA